MLNRKSIPCLFYRFFKSQWSTTDWILWLISEELSGPVVWGPGGAPPILRGPGGTNRFWQVWARSSAEGGGEIAEGAIDSGGGDS